MLRGSELDLGEGEAEAKYQRREREREVERRRKLGFLERGSAEDREGNAGCCINPPPAYQIGRAHV